MDAPKGRYSVNEKDGRLVVIDNGTGAPIPSSAAPPARPGRGGVAPVGPVSGAGPGAFDRAADLLLALAAKERDAQGRAVIAWEWRENGRIKRWDALLDEAQQRRLGRALLAMFAAPVLIVLLILADGSWFGLGLLFALPPLLWGIASLRRLHRETDDPSRRP